jgi:hypothetical protein
MGADFFEVRAAGKTPDEAYKTAVDDALFWHGNAGYTGTIAEKGGYTLFHVAAEKANDCLDALACDNLVRLTEIIGNEAYAQKMMETSNDKWGPAVAIPIMDNAWLFCGFASS